MTNLVGRPPEAIHCLIADHVDRPFRSRQVAHWILHRHAVGFDEMTNLPAELRERLARHFSIADPEVVEETTSGDGARKYLFALSDGASVEGVAMPEGRKLTLCLSSQTGCAVGCRFCVTGVLGAGRNLRPDEIVGQYRVMLRELGGDSERVNLVFMGMGEPLLNTAHLGEALDVLTERVSPKRITVSTAGILPGIRWLAARPRRPKLALSLNAPDQERRAEIMPISRRYPLDELMDEIRRFPLERGRRITFEYVLIRDFNDSEADASLLVELLAGVPSKVNVIPLNEDPDHLPGWRQPDPETVDRFGRALNSAGLTVTVRWSRGRDAAAACGQLRGRRLQP
ncbi:MAG: 23S rRNA (adenine(2503)-C(2))-methyltransferase RlmN [Deltaproteobacteria bacterium]|jgi:23S rRNA (adenine2503-C2)-methyltransferase|nr:23S rRNA (adenine(2503)-C(2))-methyltransferase RlmN [Deltaproteobacteria bacterium]MBW2535802.1 23S rRNA (adenine(2503)-C(2))-methyltransferase RlmN [Deltaproteobacteria bacterium]